MSIDEIRQRLADMRLALEELKDNDFPSYHRHRIACENFKKHAEEDIAYLLSLLEWRPIETAPKNEDILVSCVNARGEHTGIHVVYWSTVDPDGYKATYPNWMVHSGKEYCLWLAYPPTHWQPLPEPPKGGA